MPSRRRKYFINKRHQLKFILLFAGIAFLAVFVSGGIIINDIYAQVDAYLASGAIGIASTGEFILPIIFKASASAAIVLIMAIGALVALFYNRLNEVSKDVSQGIRKLKEGEFSIVSASKSRDFQAADEAMRDMFSALGQKTGSLRQAAEAIGREAEAAGEQLRGGMVSQEAISNLRAGVDDLSRALSHFKY